MRCNQGHNFSSSELKRTQLRLACGCPFTVKKSREKMGVDEQFAKRSLRAEKRENRRQQRRLKGLTG